MQLLKLNIVFINMLDDYIFFKVFMIFLGNVKGLDRSEYATHWSILCWRIVQQAELHHDSWTTSILQFRSSLRT